MVIQDSVALISDAAAGATPVDGRSAQVTSDVVSQRSTNGANTRQEEKADVAEFAPGLGVPVVP